MTSKSLFIKLQKEDLKRRIWTIALSMLVFFISIPIACTMLIGNYSIGEDHNRIMEQLIEYMGSHNMFVVLTTIVGAIICGLSSFFYLHSKKKVDLYHSIPIRRETLFTISYINGILIYIIPYVINVLLCFIILQINQSMNMEIFTASLSAIGINLLFYCLIYTIVIIAVMLTGNIVISCFGAAVFLLYGPMLMVLKEMYFQKFFKNFYGRSNYEDLLLFLSPIGIYIKKSASGINNGGSILAVIVTTIILIAFALFLYKKRSSEAAGKSMSFGFSKPIIKFLLVIPLTLGGGIIFKEISNRSSNGWYIFGLIFSLILIYAIIEIIYNFDIRSAFNYKKQMIACAGIVAIIACIFQFDLLQYDSYIPKKSKVESMSIAISGLDDNHQYFEIDNNSRFMDYASYQLKYMELTDIESVYALAELGKNSDNNSMDNNYYYNVKFKLKNGREVYRTYQLNIDETLDVVKDLYVSKEFKKAHFPIYQWDIDRIYKISCYNMFNNKEFGLDMDAKKQLVDIYKEELMNLTIEEVANTSPISTLSFQVYNSYTNYNIYPSFEKTIAFLKDYGFDAVKEVEMKDIKEIVITNYNVMDKDSMNDTPGNEINSSTNDYKTTTYTKEQDLSEIYPKLIEQQYFWSNRSIINAEENVEVTVVIHKDKYGNEGSYSYYFKQGQIPDFVKVDIGFSEE